MQHDLRYYKWLVEDSMWSSVFAADTLPEPDEEGKIPLIVYTDQSCQFMMTGLIAMRQPREDYPTIKLMYKLVDEYKCPEGIAAFLSYNMYTIGGKWLVSAGYRSGMHSPVRGEVASVQSFMDWAACRVPAKAAESKTYKQEGNWVKAGGVHNFWKGDDKFFDVFDEVLKLATTKTVTTREPFGGDTTTTYYDPATLVASLVAAVAAYEA
jgi:hypothetical protein